MNQYKFQKTKETAEVFEDAGIKYRHIEKPDSEALEAVFHVDNVPDFSAYFIFRGEDAPVGIRIFDIVQNVSKDRQSRVLEACNILNCTVQFLKFMLSEDGSVELVYDIPSLNRGRETGEIAIGILIGTLRVLDEQYAFLMKAVFSDEPLSESDLDSGQQPEGGQTLPAAHPDPGLLS